MRAADAPLVIGWIALLCVVACSPRSDPDTALPKGIYLAGDAAALRRALSPLSGLAGTPVARAAAALSARVEGCRHFAAHAPSGVWSTLLDATVCLDEPLAPEVDALREHGDLVFLLPIGTSGSDERAPRLRGHLDVGPEGSVTIDAALWPLPSEGVLARALPGEQAAGAPALNTRDLLLHGRLRPAGGIDLAALAGDAGEGGRLLELKSALLARAVLDGTVEVGVYMPGEGQRIPPMAFALGVSMPEAARAAMETFVAELESTWPLHAQPASFGESAAYQGRCILDLKILPEFAPCYALTGDSIVIGWNPPSVAQAIAPLRDDEVPGDGGLYVALSRLPEADRRLHRSNAPDRPEAARTYGWEALRARGLRGPDDEVKLRIELVAGEAS